MKKSKTASSKSLEIGPQVQITNNIIENKMVKPNKLSSLKTMPKIPIHRMRSFHLSPPHALVSPYPYMEFKPYTGSKYPMFQLRRRRSHQKSKRRKPHPQRLKPTKVIENNETDNLVLLR